MNGLMSVPAALFGIALALLAGAMALAAVAGGRNRAAGMPEPVEDGAVWHAKKLTSFGMPWTFTNYWLDAERLIIQSGLLVRRTDEVRLYRIRDVSMVQDLMQRVAGVGSIRVSSADRTMGDFTIGSVACPQEVYELISGLVEESRHSRGVAPMEFISQ